MPDDINTDGGDATGGEQTQQQTQTQPPPQQTIQQAGPPPGQPAKVVSMPTHAIGKLKEEAYTKGQQAAIADLAAKAGFSTPEELAQVLAALKQKPTTTPAPTQRTAPTQGDDDAPLTPEDLAKSKDARRMEARFQRQLESVTTERNRFQQQLQQQQQQAKAAKEEAEALRAEMYLRTMAAQKGVQDIDYAITLFSRAVENLSPEDAEKFDEAAFFDQLKASKPLLFGETVVPASTGTSPGSTTAAPPKAADVTRSVATGGKPDVKKMNAAEFAAELRKRGIQA